MSLALKKVNKYDNVFPSRTLFEEYCSARKTLGADESQIGKLNEKVKELVQALEKRLECSLQCTRRCRAIKINTTLDEEVIGVNLSALVLILLQCSLIILICIIILRYPTELEKAIEAHLGSLRGTEDISEEGTGDVVAEGSIWTMDLVSLALAGVKSQVQSQHSVRAQFFPCVMSRYQFTQVHVTTNQRHYTDLCRATSSVWNFFRLNFRYLPHGGIIKFLGCGGGGGGGTCPGSCPSS